MVYSRIECWCWMFVDVAEVDWFEGFFYTRVWGGFFGLFSWSTGTFRENQTLPIPHTLRRQKREPSIYKVQPISHVRATLQYARRKCNQYKIPSATSIYSPSTTKQLTWGKSITWWKSWRIRNTPHRYLSSLSTPLCDEQSNPGIDFSGYLKISEINRSLNLSTVEVFWPLSLSYSSTLPVCWHHHISPKAKFWVFWWAWWATLFDRFRTPRREKLATIPIKITNSRA